MYKNILKASGLLIISLTLIIGCNQMKENKDVEGLDLSNIDSTVSPQNDFYDYAVGNWLKNNKIPDEYSRWGSFEMLAERNYEVLHKILDSASSDKAASPNSNIYKVGMFYSLGMDTTKIDTQGYSTIKDELDRVEAVKNKDDL